MGSKSIYFTIDSTDRDDVRKKFDQLAHESFKKGDEDDYYKEFPHDWAAVYELRFYDDPEFNRTYRSFDEAYASGRALHRGDAEAVRYINDDGEECTMVNAVVYV